jgi:hypothetical protein
MTDPKIVINPTTFPSQLATDAQKASQEFGLQVGLAVQSEWFRKDAGSCRFYNQWIEFHRLRLYARGEQSVEKYKKEMSFDGDLSYLNLSWTPVPIMPKFIDIVVNGMADRNFSVKAVAQDAMAAEKRNQFQDMIEGDMVAKDFLLQTKEQFGVDAFNTNVEELPSNDEELQLYMQLKYKPSIEIAEEEAINTLLEQNNYADTKKRVDYDLTTLGIGGVKHSFYPGAGVKVEYVDPANVVYSYTESPYFDDVFYWGEVKQVPITELIKIKPDITKEELEEISQLGTAWWDYYGVMRTYRNDLFDKDVVTLLFFNYKTDKTFVYKKKFLDNGGERVIRKDEGFNPPADQTEERFEKVEKRIDVWYEGIMVLGSNKLIKWEMSKNMARPKSASQFAYSNYVMVAPRMYKGAIESLGRRMTAFADLIQMTHLKLQQVLSKMVPDGVFIDADGLNEVDLGNGAAYNPEDALRMYFQTGSVIGRSYTQDGEFNNARVPIQELNSSAAQGKISSLIAAYNQYMSMLRDVTGLNEARDGSMPSSDALVGVQKLAAANSNTATRHILDGGIFITRRLSEALSCRISDILEYADFRDEFANQIGKYNIQILDSIKELYLHNFGIFIEVSPDEEEKQQLEANIQMALSRDQIALEDAIDIREIKNLKLANQLLKVKRKDKEKRDMDKQQMMSKFQSDSNIAATQAAAEAKMQQIQADTQSKIQIKEAESMFAIQTMEQEARIKLSLMQQEFQMNMQLKGLESQVLTDKDKMKEEAKDKRVSIQNTQQSKLIDQRKNNLPPIDFESNEDTLDGFDLAGFEPK